MVMRLHAPAERIAEPFLDGYPHLGGQLVKLFPESLPGNLPHLLNEHGLGHLNVMPQGTPTFADISLHVMLKRRALDLTVHSSPPPRDELACYSGSMSSGRSWAPSCPAVVMYWSCGFSS